MDNFASMNYFLNQIMTDGEVLEDLGTYVELLFEGQLIGIHSGGNGDFYSHKMDFEILD